MNARPCTVRSAALDLRAGGACLEGQRLAGAHVARVHDVRRRVPDVVVKEYLRSGSIQVHPQSPPGAAGHLHALRSMTSLFSCKAQQTQLACSPHTASCLITTSTASPTGHVRSAPGWCHGRRGPAPAACRRASARCATSKTGSSRAAPAPWRTSAAIGG